MATPYIVRNVRKEASNRLNIVQDVDHEDQIKINSSWQDEINGDPCEEIFIEEVLSESSDDMSFVLDENKEFEESSNDNISQESQIFKEVKLHSEIVVIVLEEDEQRYQSCDIECVRWTAADRKKTQIPLTEDDFEITDIYRTTGLFTATEVSMEVQVNLPKTHIPHHAAFEYFLVVETEGNKWLTLPSKLTTSNDTSLTKLPDYMEISSICAIARRISEKLIVTEDGFEFVSSLDTRVKLDFPMGAVDNNTDIEIQISPIDQKRVRELKEYNPKLFNTILNMSDVVSVKYEHTKDFNKNVKIQLPMSLKMTNERNFTPKPLFIRWNGTQPEILNGVITKIQPDIYATSVTHFSDAAAVFVDPNASQEEIFYAAEIISGKSEICKILTFYTFEILGSQPSLWVELVLSKNKDEIRKKREARGLTELPYSFSPDMQIKNQERVHVALKLNIEFPPGICKSSFYLKLDLFCPSNHFSFPVVKKERMCSAPYAAIEYKFSKSKEIHPIHFDPVTMKKNLLLPTKNPAQGPLTRPSNDNDRQQSQRQNTGFGLKRKEHKSAWQDPSSQNMSRPNQGQAHNDIHQITRLPGDTSIPPPPPQCARSSHVLRRSNQSHSDSTFQYQMTEFPPPRRAWPVQSAKNMISLNHRHAPYRESQRLRLQETQQASYSSMAPSQRAQFSEDQNQTITPESLTETGVPDDPMFSQKSMMMLAETYGNETGKKLAICLEFSHEEIKIISERNTGFNPNFEILVEWLLKTNQMRQRQNRYGLLKKAFQSIGRVDMEELIEKVRRENRGFTNKDKP
ncbi:hypothetical protein LOTGIDRAFT_160408 [Lottia gigantea]|uniref:Death domain-containing protein n=1 Tax=Lottia gigantea TaxID=225164 RepID=V3ZUW2_LOTGI|nr:hypothetical protein LOTGIDRAFT_160408 [Lottia gigantea]ESO95288.1 hypothetical protein LOTGIDRAFT_160408 [Lottia gigantea]